MFLLDVKDLTKRFGGVRALEEVSFRVRDGAIVSVIGPNGAGKTTLFNCLTGLTPPTSGHIHFMDRDLSGLQAHLISRAGIARTFQNIRLFQGLSALENIMVAQHHRAGYGPFSSVIRGSVFRACERALRERAFEYLQLVGLEDSALNQAGALSYGSQRRLEIARALATEPRILLLDEPTAGMNPMETSGIMGLIHEVRQMGKTVLLIEHDMRLVMGISDWVVVLDHGVKIAEGAPEEVRNDRLVIEAYLGTEAHH